MSPGLFEGIGWPGEGIEKRPKRLTAPALKVDRFIGLIFFVVLKELGTTLFIWRLQVL